MDKNRNTFRLSVLMLVLALCGQSGLHLLFHSVAPAADACGRSVFTHHTRTEYRLGAADIHDYSRWLDFSGSYCPCCSGSVFAAELPETFGRIAIAAAAEKIRPGTSAAVDCDEISSGNPRAPPESGIRI